MVRIRLPTITHDLPILRLRIVTDDGERVKTEVPMNSQYFHWFSDDGELLRTGLERTPDPLPLAAKENSWCGAATSRPASLLRRHADHAKPL
jgi:hypothetical protein